MNPSFKKVIEANVLALMAVVSYPFVLVFLIQGFNDLQYLRNDPECEQMNDFLLVLNLIGSITFLTLICTCVLSFSYTRHQKAMGREHSLPDIALWFITGFGCLSYTLGAFGLPFFGHWCNFLRSTPSGILVCGMYLCVVLGTIVIALLGLAATVKFFSKEVVFPLLVSLFVIIRDFFNGWIDDLKTAKMKNDSIKATTMI